MTKIRAADLADAAACAAIYAPYVTGTAITFELVAPSADEVGDRITEAQRFHEWLVAEQDERVVGYAYGHRFSGRAAYDWSCETSIYLTAGAQGTGLGRALYGELLSRLAALGYRRALAGIALPNEASVGLHRALGFYEAGRYRRVGWKLDAWHDVAWMQCDLQSNERDPPPPIAPPSPR